MKSFQDLEAMQVPQLKAIARDLGIAHANNIKKADLVNLVFHAQQPDPDELEQDQKNREEGAKVEQNIAENQPTAAEKVDQMLEKISTFFGGNLVETEEEDDGVVFEVVDPTGDVIVSGTYSQLVEKMEEAEKIRIQMQLEQNPKDIKPLDANELSVPEPERGVAPPAVPQEQIEVIENELAPLRKLGLKATLTSDSVELVYRGRTVTTTIHQPVHRIVKVAEAHIARV